MARIGGSSSVSPGGSSIAGGDRPNELQRLSDRHLQMIELALSGRNRGEIASALGVNPETISVITRSPLYQAELARRRQERQRKLDSAAVAQTVQASRIVDEASSEAAETMRSLMRSSLDERNRLSAAKDLLDRAGIGRGVQQVGNTVHINELQIQLLVTSLREAKQLRGELSSVEQASSASSAPGSPEALPEASAA